MTFEPRLIRDEEPDDPLSLPDDLAELAAQLSADAEHLAERYPAAQLGPPPPPTVDRGRRLLRAAAALVFLCGASVVAGRAWHDAARPSRVAERATAAAPGPTASGRAALDVNPAEHDSRPSGRAAIRGAAQGGSALVFGSLSGGEQEGVLDLLEEQPAAEPSVSI